MGACFPLPVGELTPSGTELLRQQHCGFQETWLRRAGSIQSQQVALFPLEQVGPQLGMQPSPGMQAMRDLCSLQAPKGPRQMAGHDCSPGITAPSLGLALEASAGLGLHH